MVVPTTKDLELTDTQYRIAARLNLGLLPMEGVGSATQHLPIVQRTHTVKKDPWHFMTCLKQPKEEISVRHDEVESTLYRCALIMGLQAVKQPAGLAHLLTCDLT